MCVLSVFAHFLCFHHPPVSSYNFIFDYETVDDEKQEMSMTLRCPLNLGFIHSLIITGRLSIVFVFFCVRPVIKEWMVPRFILYTHDCDTGLPSLSTSLCHKLWVKEYEDIDWWWQGVNASLLTLKRQLLDC